MTQRRRRKCRYCGNLFRADPRNRRHQKYCSIPACREAAKAARQRRWLSKPENRDYFRGAANIERVRAWRAVHPGYWRRSGPQRVRPLQDDSYAQPVELPQECGTLVPTALQDVFTSQPAVLIGLIANITGSALQDDIAETSRRLLRLGQDILGGRLDHASQSGDMPRAEPQSPRAVQLGGPSAGAGPPPR